MKINAAQLDTLKFELSQLAQIGVMLNILHTRTDLERLDDCEMQIILEGIESLFYHHYNTIEKRIDFICGKEADNEK